MSADKRSVFTDALETVGTIITEKEERDAVHFAVENVVAGQYMAPGAHVVLVDKKAYAVASGTGVGIVDPFLPASGVKPGERFWLFVYPRKITSLRHVWTHPDFDSVEDLPVVEEKAKDEDNRVTLAKEWIKDYANRLSGEDYDDHYYTITYDELMHYASTWIDDKTGWGGDYLVKGGLLEGVMTEPEFWDHYETITGKRPPSSKYYQGTPSFFSCSC